MGFDSPPPTDPYHPPKPAPPDFAIVKRRNIAVFVLLMIVTLGIYWFYVVYAWAKEINSLMGQEKYPPAIVLLLNIVTCGIAGVVYECLFAFNLVEFTATHSIVGRSDNLGNLVLILNVLGLTVCGPLGIVASAFFQAELNKLAPPPSMVY